MLNAQDMAEQTEKLDWGIVFQVIVWTAIAVGFIMAMAVFLMH